MGSHLQARLRGRIEPPGDKSVGHRLGFLSALAEGRSRLERFPPGRDCGRTIDLIEALGVETRREGDVLEIEGRGGFAGLRAPAADLDAGNSGSTARMACGFLAPAPFDARLVGDESLSRRPFDRVVEPLTRMGALFETSNGRLPLTVRGGRELEGLTYELPVPSAQVKTAILFAGLSAKGTTTVVERLPSRDHTEIALAGFGAAPRIVNGTVRVEGGTRLKANRFRLPGDFSSAAFFVGGAAFLPGSDLVVEEVGLNPTRAGFLHALKDMGANIGIETEATTDGEPRGGLRVRGAPLHATVVPAERVPALIDEIPILAVVAAFAEGPTRIEGASELRVKESDRLEAIVEGLTALGVRVEPLPGDGLVIHGTGGATPLRPAALRAHGDHRMVMAWAIASLGVDGDCKIEGLEHVKISYPTFWDILDQLVH